MAYEIGTATDYDDLFEKLRTFLKTNTDLVTASQNWTELAYVSTSGAKELYLQGPGAGSDSIHVNLAQIISVPGDYYNWKVAGATAYSGAQSFDTQPGVSARRYISLWDSSIDYWFVANGRRFIVIAKVSTVFVSLYCGFINQYAVPSEFPYPIYIGANGISSTKRWSDAGTEHRAFWAPAWNSGQFRATDGAWEYVYNFNNGGAVNPNQHLSINPYNITWVRDNIDGTHQLYQFEIIGTVDGGNVFGALDGVYWVSGFSNAAENILQVGGVDYLVVPDIFRTNPQDYAAIRIS